MMTKNADKKREQMMMFSMDSMVPQDHMLRLIDKAINWNFIYDLVEDKYCQNNGRPSMDPVMLIKIPFIQYLYGIKSMRQTIREIEVNVAYRWFLGLDMLDPVPHFSTFGKNYSRRFKDTDLFEQIFSKILEEEGFSDFVDFQQESQILRQMESEQGQMEKQISAYMQKIQDYSSRYEELCRYKARFSTYCSRAYG